MLFGNATNDVYTYSIKNNTWALYTPTVTRQGGVTGGGMTADWVFDVQDPAWIGGNNGRYIYSFRGAGSAVLNRLDLTTRAWELITYMPNVETFTTGSGSDYSRNYIYVSKENSGRFFRFNIVANRLVPWSTCIYPNSTAMAGDKVWTKVYKDKTTGDTIEWLYSLLHNSNILMRCMMIKD